MGLVQLHSEQKVFSFNKWETIIVLARINILYMSLGILYRRCTCWAPSNAPVSFSHKLQMDHYH